MKESLRHVADLAIGMRVVLLRQQTDVVGQADQPLEQSTGFNMATLQLVNVSKSKRTRYKRTFARRQAVSASFGAITQHKTIYQQVALDRLYRSNQHRDPRATRLIGHT